MARVLDGVGSRARGLYNPVRARPADLRIFFVGLSNALVPGIASLGALRRVFCMHRVVW